jgi:hypothetical protein
LRSRRQPPYRRRRSLRRSRRFTGRIEGSHDDRVDPDASGTLTVQLVVPFAVPATPAPPVHFTATTLTLCVAVPDTVIDAADVVTIVAPESFTVGAVVSFAAAGVAGALGATGVSGTL